MTPVSRIWMLAGAAVCLLAVAAARWRNAIPDDPGVVTGIVALRYDALRSTSDRSLTDAEQATVENDPFRLSNSPSLVRYVAGVDAAAAAATPSPSPRPTLVLKAIVGGPPWQAVVDGLPGQPQGTTVETGSRFDKLIVKAVTRDSVIVQAPDTSWVLSFRKRS